MLTQRSVILERLRGHGWAVTSLDDHAPEWWAEEIWLLKSTRTPVGKRAYLTFLVDPQADPATRKRGEGVWAVSASAIKPLSREEAEARFIVSLGSGWMERLPGLLEYLNTVRDAALSR